MDVLANIDRMAETEDSTLLITCFVDEGGIGEVGESVDRKDDALEAVEVVLSNRE